MIEAIDHIGIAVADMQSALVTYRDCLGLAEVGRERVERQGVEAIMLECGSSHVELLAALGPDTPVGKYLVKRGPGIHHVAYRVDDIERTLAQIVDQGVRVIDSEPRIGFGGSKVAFIHPASVGGVLTELVEPPRGGES